MPIQYTAHRVGDRFIGIVALYQHCKQPGNIALALPARPGAFQKTRQFAEHAGRITSGGGRLSGRQTDFSLRLGKPGQIVHQAQNLAAPRAEILCQRKRGMRGLAAHQSRGI